MVARSLYLVCAQAFFIHCALSQCINRGLGLTYEGLSGPGLAGIGLAGPSLAGPSLVGYGCSGTGIASTGGGFPVTRFSPLAPTGISIISENAFEGFVNVGGALPFLSVVVLDGVLPTAGTGAISYGCGSGSVGIAAEGPITTGIVGSVYGSGLAGPGLASPALAAPGLTGPNLAGPFYGPGLAPGLRSGMGSVSCGCSL